MKNRVYTRDYNNPNEKGFPSETDLPENCQIVFKVGDSEFTVGINKEQNSLIISKKIGRDHGISIRPSASNLIELM